MIASNLETLTLMCLKLTNHHFYHTLNPVREKKLLLLQNELYVRQCNRAGILNINLSSIPAAFMACTICMQVRSSGKFADKQHICEPGVRAPRYYDYNDSKGPCTDPDLAIGALHHDLEISRQYLIPRRFCIDCGISRQERGYMEGSLITVDGRDHVVCKRCKKVGRCSDASFGYLERSKMCDECFAAIPDVVMRAMIFDEQHKR